MTPFENGIALLNDGKYHEALDEFETPYRAASGEIREFYLGWVRMSAAMYHFEAGRFRSARKLYATAAELLGNGAKSHEGLDLQGGLADFEELFRPLLSASDAEAAALRPDRRPVLEVRVG